MDIAGLRHFIVAARRQHFGQAAEELGIAQPALSLRIKTLEARLGVRLFDRAHRAVHLTEAGRVFLGEAERLVHDAEIAVRITQAADRGTAGELHIGYSGSVIFEPKVCALLKAFRLQYPDASVVMHECNVEEQLDRVRAGHLDVALLWGPLGTGYPDLRDRVFVSTTMSVVLARDHPLADMVEIDPAQIGGEDFIALIDRPGRGLSHVTDAIFAAAGIAPRVVMRVSSLMSLFGLAGSGLGIGFVPSLPIAVNATAFVQRPLAGIDACNDILIVSGRRRITRLAGNFMAMMDDHG